MDVRKKGLERRPQAQIKGYGRLRRPTQGWEVSGEVMMFSTGLYLVCKIEDEQD